MLGPFNDLSTKAVKIHSIGRAFPWLMRTILQVPKRIPKRMVPSNEVFDVVGSNTSHIDALVEAGFDEAQASQSRMGSNEKTPASRITVLHTVLHEMMNGDKLPPAERTLARIKKFR